MAQDPKLSYDSRRRWSLIILLIGLPLYIGLALFVVSLFERPPFLLELLVYVVLGFLWMIPFKFVFLGVGKAAPDASDDTKENTN